MLFILGPPITIDYLSILGIEGFYVYYFILAFWSLIFIILTGTPRPQEIDFKSHEISLTLIGLGAAFTLHLILREFIPVEIPWFNSGYVIIRGLTLEVLLTLASAVVIGISLEVALRGYLFTLLRGRYGVIISTVFNCVISATLFASLGPGAALYNPLFPLIPIALLIRTNTLKTPIIFHVTYRIVADVLIPLIS